MYLGAKSFIETIKPKAPKNKVTTKDGKASVEDCDEDEEEAKEGLEDETGSLIGCNWMKVLKRPTMLLTLLLVMFLARHWLSSIRYVNQPLCLFFA